MSTNFYAEVKIAPSVTWTVHIGQRASHGLCNFSGIFFPSWQDMKTFLIHNNHELLIRDEYYSYHDLNWLIEEIEDTTVEDRTAQYNYVAKNNPEMIGSPDKQLTYWLDKDNFTFFGGEFC